jgi:hypothetical protein
LNDSELREALGLVRRKPAKHLQKITARLSVDAAERPTLPPKLEHYLPQIFVVHLGLATALLGGVGEKQAEQIVEVFGWAGLSD